MLKPLVLVVVGVKALDQQMAIDWIVANDNPASDFFALHHFSYQYWQFADKHFKTAL